MAARALTIKGRDWYREEREPAKATDRMVVVDPKKFEALKGCPKFMSAQEVGDLLGFSRYAVYSWMSRGILQCQNIAGKKRITREQLAAFLELENLKKR